MIKSMTGFGSAQIIDPLLRRASLEIKSQNSRFLEIVFNLPQGLGNLEDKLKREIGKQVKRGRIVASLEIAHRPYEKIVMNKGMVNNYFQILNKLKRQFSLKDEITLDMMMRLPGVVNAEEIMETKERIWSKLTGLILSALDRLEASRKKAGKVLYLDLIARIDKLKKRLQVIKKISRLAISKKASKIETLEEKTSFIKSADITEELTLLNFHLNNFKTKLNKSIPVGKELDFIAQEIQREVNTLAAKSFDALVLASAVEMKSQIEKVREQLQNVE